MSEAKAFERAVEAVIGPPYFGEDREAKRPWAVHQVRAVLEAIKPADDAMVRAFELQMAKRSNVKLGFAAAIDALLASQEER